MKPTLASLCAVYLVPGHESTLICEQDEWSAFRRRRPGLVLARGHIPTERQAGRIATESDRRRAFGLVAPA